MSCPGKHLLAQASCLPGQAQACPGKLSRKLAQASPGQATCLGKQVLAQASKCTRYGIKSASFVGESHSSFKVVYIATCDAVPDATSARACMHKRGARAAATVRRRRHASPDAACASGSAAASERSASSSTVPGRRAEGRPATGTERETAARRRRRGERARDGRGRAGVCACGRDASCGASGARASAAATWQALPTRGGARRPERAA